MTLMKPTVQQALGVDRIPFESQLQLGNQRDELFAAEKAEIRDNIKRWHSVESDNQVVVLNGNQ